MLDRLYYGNTLEQWLISAIIILGSFLIANLILSINKKFIFRLTGRSKSRLDDILVRTLQSPLLFAIILVSVWVAFKRLNLNPHFEKYITEAYKVLTVINITWFFKCLLHALIIEYLSPKENEISTKKRIYFDSHKITLIQKVTTAVVWTLGILFALNNAGVKIGAILGTLGIGGIAFAMAAQDTIKNIFGGFTIFTDGTFRIGDRIKVGGYDGFVEDIGIRSTRIRTLEKRLVMIPNYKIVEGAVENISEEPMFRVKTKLNLDNSTTSGQMKKALQILREIADENPQINKDTTAAVFSDFEDNSLTITFIYFIKKGGNAVLIPSEVNTRILERFETENIQFISPQSIFFNKGKKIE